MKVALPQEAEDRKKLLIIYFLMVVSGLLVSLLRYWQDPLLNSDGVLYAHMARLMVHGESASHLLDLSYYPRMIALVSSAFFSGDVITGGQFLNAALQAVSGLAFLRLVTAMGVSAGMLWLPALLFLSNPAFIDYRSYFIRDFWIWSFGLLAVSEAVLFMQDRRSYRILLWPLWLGLGTMFRYETPILGLASVGLLFALGRPTLQAMWLFLRFNTLAIVAVLIGIAAVAVGLFGDLVAPFEVSMNRLQSSAGISDFERFKLGFEQYASPYAADEATYILGAGFLSLIPKKMLGAIGLPGVLLAIFFVRRRFAAGISGWPVWFASVIAVLIYLSAFTLKRGFLTERYSLFGALLVLAVIACCLVFSVQQKGRMVKATVVGLLMLGFADGFVSTGSSKGYMMDAIRWAKDVLPASSELMSNKAQLAMQPLKGYNHERFRSISFLKGTNTFATAEAIALWQESDYLLMRYKDDQLDYEQAMLDTRLLEEVKQFKNKEGDRVIVYKVIH